MNYWKATAVALALAACGSTDKPTTTTTATTDALTACLDIIGQPASSELLESGCAQGDGSAFYGGALSASCDDGREIVWNDVAWGYVGEPLRAPSPEGDAAQAGCWQD